MSSTTGIRPTKGFLMEMKRRIGFIERGTEFLKLKRDHLAKELTASIEVLKGRRRLLLENLRMAYRAVTAAYISLGPTEVRSQASSIKSRLELEILPRSVMGVRYPFIKVEKEPQIAGELDITLSEAAEKVLAILDEIIQLAEFEARAERIADELGKTNRKVNALENTIIPGYKQIIKFIEDKLDEESLEELVRMKLIGGALARRRE
ncbi:MAG: V-type ATP synthase subunit D [Candidatus Bathyarchaeota archaeon]|nr:V-type ATP synthase subunit D [Candidatus Bathyarchaeota archaeon]MDH5791863.1 V-type ATP synthase subunit D [Candidatus Bathyarchaeota archaeon]